MSETDHSADGTERVECANCGEHVPESEAVPGPHGHAVHEDCLGGTDRFEASSSLFDRWIGKASENIEEWGLQDEETLLLAIQEELGELTQAHLEATHEDGDPDRVSEELDDLGVLLLQLHESHNNRSLQADGDQP